MRVTEQQKQATRADLLREAGRLFRDQGVEATTTRQIAAAAGVANGTLFNYFPGKEALAMTLVLETLEDAEHRFESGEATFDSLDEALFAHVAIGLRQLRGQRRYAGRVIEMALSPLSRGTSDERVEQWREHHLATVLELIGRHRPEHAASSELLMHLYWTLYVGVLAFWSTDESPRQEDTLALLDRSIGLFVAGLDLPITRSTESSHAPNDR